MQITLKNKKILPLMQGGMGVGVSLSGLAGNMALNNAIGTISAVNIGYREKDFWNNSLEANLRALRNEIKKAREISKEKGLIAVNIMTAINNYDEMVKCAAEEKIDIIVSGAGLPLHLPSLVDENILIAPIVSSKRALSVIVKTWKKRYNRFPDLVVVEGPLAGGHLGFNNDDLKESSLKEIVKDVKEYVNSLKDEINKKIYVFAAGGIRDKKDRNEIMDSGADGIQVATPFIVSEECDAHINFKKEIVNSKDSDIKIINSPVGMIARAVENKFVKSLNERIAPTKCIRCLKTCNPATTPYCITEALNNSVMGVDGLVFSGYGIDKINKIEPLKKIIDRLMEE